MYDFVQCRKIEHILYFVQHSKHTYILSVDMDTKFTIHFEMLQEMLFVCFTQMSLSDRCLALRNVTQLSDVRLTKKAKKTIFFQFWIFPFAVVSIHSISPKRTEKAQFIGQSKWKSATEFAAKIFFFLHNFSYCIHMNLPVCCYSKVGVFVRLFSCHRYSVLSTSGTSNNTQYTFQYNSSAIPYDICFYFFFNIFSSIFPCCNLFTASSLSETTRLCSIFSMG